MFILTYFTPNAAFWKKPFSLLIIDGIKTVPEGTNKPEISLSDTASTWDNFSVYDSLTVPG